MVKYYLLLMFLLFSSVNEAQEQSKEQSNNQQQQENKAPTSDKTEATDTEPQSSVNESEIKQPISQIKLYESDLEHYLPENIINKVMVGPDSHISLITPHIAANQKGVMVLLPEWQQPATSPQALNFLQQKLPEQGWVTVAMQPLAMPSNYPSTAVEPETQAEQNKQAIEQYQQTLKALVTSVMEKAKNYPGIIVFVAQGHNAMLVSELFAAKEIPLPQALVLLSAQMSTKTIEQSAEKLASIELPILDLYLRVDSPVVKQQANIRQKHVYYLAKSQFRQKQLYNIYAGYYQGEPLIKEINGWLKSIGW